MSIPTLPPVPLLTKDGFADPVWAKWMNLLRQRMLSAVVALQFASTNGFSGVVSSSNSGTLVTLSIGPSGMLKGSAGAVVAAVAGTDYVSPANPGAVTAVGMDSTGGFSSHGSAGITATITTAKLTTGGATGSMTFKDGLLIGQVPAT